MIKSQLLKWKCLEQGFPTLGPLPTTGPWPVGNQATQVAGWHAQLDLDKWWAGTQLHAQLNLREQWAGVYVREICADWVPFSPSLLGRQGVKVGDRWV